MSSSTDQLIVNASQNRIAETPNIRKAVRRLRWFLNAFDQQLSVVSERTGHSFSIDRPKLTEAFIAWLRQFEQQQNEAQRDRKEFTYFCAGLMLSELIRRQPVTLETRGRKLDDSDPAAFWPEGYSYVAFCLNVAAAVLDQEFDYKAQLHPMTKDVETWWSFRENTRELPSMAIPFLDIFMGLRPSWDTPTIFNARERFKNEQIEQDEQQGLTHD